MPGSQPAVELYLFNKLNKPEGVLRGDTLYNLFSDMKTSENIVLIAFLFLIACQNKSNQLPGIFGKWEIVQIWDREQEIVEALRVSDKITLVTGRTIDFNKDNFTYFYHKDTLQQTVEFNYSGDGLYLTDKSKVIGLRNILIYDDTMIMHINDVVLKMKRKT